MPQTIGTAMIEKLHANDAVIAVDPQIDFCPGGALPVPEGDEVIPVLNLWIDRAGELGATVVISRDWHPQDHCSFESQGGTWPVHCVQNTRGAAYHPELHVPAGAIHVSKAADPARESLSDFTGSGLGASLRRKGVKRIWVGGLALDYCVRATVLEALAEGFEVHLLLPATRAVNVNAGDGEQAIEEMRVAGAVIEEDAS